MVLLYVSVGRIGREVEMNLEFEGETWLAAWEKVDAWMRKNRWEDCWFEVKA